MQGFITKKTSLLPIGLIALSLMLVLGIAGCGGKDEEPEPPAIGHTLIGRSDCSLCHESGLLDIPSEPTNHEGRTDQLCTICHKPLGEESTGAGNTPHSITGREECLICHTTGIASAPSAGDEMAGLSNEHCLLCHITDEGEIVGLPGDGTPVVGHGLDAPQAPHTFEGRTECLACHSTSIPTGHTGRTGAGDTCTLCHVGTDSEAPIEAAARPIPHSLQGRADCLACHIESVPASHAGRPNEACELCHSAGEIPAPTPTPLLVIQPTPAGPPTAGATPTPTVPAATGPVPIPHTLEGRSDCLLCHGVSLPANHTGRKSETCTMCHAQGGVAESTPTPLPPSPQAPTITPVPTATVSAPSAPTPSPTPSTAVGVPPISHTLDGRDNCLACHGASLPASHSGRTNETCTICHSPAELPTPTPPPPATPTPTPAPAMPTPTAPPPTATAAPVGGPPAIPHSLEGRTDCLLCHGSSIPDDHQGRANNTCTVCHNAQ